MKQSLHLHLAVKFNILFGVLKLIFVCYATARGATDFLFTVLIAFSWTELQTNPLIS